jgi:hypothetical protein
MGRRLHDTANARLPGFMESIGVCFRMGKLHYHFEDCEIGDFCPIEVNNSKSDLQIARPSTTAADFDVTKPVLDASKPSSPVKIDYMVFSRASHDGREVWMRKS